jgi:LPXTG-motif cell wall-anchored protein
VTQGETVAVVGDGCAPDAAVAIEFNGQPTASTQADAQGAFRGSLAVPTYVIDDTVEEASEASIAAACGDQRVAVVVAVSEAEDAVGGRDALPETGAGATVALSTLGVSLIAAGAALVRRFGVRPAHGGR